MLKFEKKIRRQNVKLLHVNHNQKYLERKLETRMEHACVLVYIFVLSSLTNRQYHDMFKLGSILVKFYNRGPAKILWNQLKIHKDWSNKRDRYFIEDEVKSLKVVEEGRSMFSTVSQWTLTADAPVRPQAIPCGICGRQTGGVTGFYPRHIAIEGSLNKRHNMSVYNWSKIICNSTNESTIIINI